MLHSGRDQDDVSLVKLLDGISPNLQSEPVPAVTINTVRPDGCAKQSVHRAEGDQLAGVCDGALARIGVKREPSQ